MRLLLITDIDYFDIKRKSSKSDNDNKIREDVLCAIGNDNVPLEWFENIKWKKLKDSFLLIIKEICNEGYTSIKIEHKGGRNFNYDFIIYYYDDDKIIYDRHIEFKYNCKKIQKYPQFLSVSCKQFIKDTGYAEYFYDNYLKNIASLIKIDQLPLKEDYIKYIYQINYSKLPLFTELYNNETNIKKEKKQLVDISIKKYLTDIIELDIDSLNCSFSSKQSDKIYVMYCDGVFYKDYITSDELTVIKIEKIKNNTIVLQTNSASKINMLLRWKNHAGILFPAWQISIRR